MKKLLLVFLLAYIIPAYCQWNTQQSGVTTPLNDVYCISENAVVVVGDFGVILKTTDGGDHWISKSSPTTEPIVKVQFINATVGFAVTSVGSILKTIDGGEHWASASNNTSNSYSGLSCLNENALFISNGTLQKSTDGGQTFTSINAPPEIKAIQFFDEQTGYISCVGGFYKTTDGGNNWTTILTDYNIFSFFFINENIGFIQADSGNLKTVDGFQNFTPFYGFSNQIMGQDTDMFATNQNTLWSTDTISLLCGCPPEACISKIDWNDNPENPLISNCVTSSNPYISYNALYFANETTGYVVGYSFLTPGNSKGLIYKNTTGTMEVMGVEQNKKEAFKIYPNPAQDNIHLSFEQSSKSAVWVEIVDGLGQTVFGQKYPTSDLITIDTKSLAKGIYFLSVDQNQNKQTQKIIIY